MSHGSVHPVHKGKPLADVRVCPFCARSVAALRDGKGHRYPCPCIDVAIDLSVGAVEESVGRPDRDGRDPGTGRDECSSDEPTAAPTDIDVDRVSGPRVSEGGPRRYVGRTHLASGEEPQAEAGRGGRVGPDTPYPDHEQDRDARELRECGCPSWHVWSCMDNPYRTEE